LTAHQARVLAEQASQEGLTPVPAE